MYTAYNARYWGGRLPEGYYGFEVRHRLVAEHGGQLSRTYCRTKVVLRFGPALALFPFSDKDSDRTMKPYRAGAHNTVHLKSHGEKHRKEGRTSSAWTIPKR